MTEKREILRDALVVAVLSMLMGAIVHWAWRNVYSQATRIEEILLAQIPGVSEGGIQILAMFGIGLYFTWLVLYTHDIRKRIQGLLFIVGSLFALAILYVLGTFWPYVDATAFNLLALGAGVVAGLGSEFFETPLHDGDPALFEIDLGESSIGHVVTQESDIAEFPVASYGIFLLLATLAVGAIVALWLAEASPLVIGVAAVVSLLFIWRLRALLGHEVTGIDIEILGPQGSGKSLFFYGLDLTIDDDDTPYRSVRTDDAWMSTIKESKQRQGMEEDPWGFASTVVDTEFALSFRREGISWEFVDVTLTDFPGGWLEDIFNAGRSDSNADADASRAISDGGTTSGESEGDGYEFMPGSGQPTELEDIDGVTVDMADALREAGYETPDDIAGSEIDDLIEVEGIGIATAADMLQDVGEPGDWPAEDADTATEDADAASGDATVPRGPSNVSSLEDSLLGADKILAVIDTKAAIDAGLLPADETEVRGADPDDRNQATPKVDVMWKICSIADPDEIVLVATKTDYLIPKYMQEMGKTAEPHDELGDFEEFREWVNAQFDRQPFASFRGGNVCETIYPVYYRSEEDENGKVVPALDDREMQPEGFEAIIEERLLG